MNHLGWKEIHSMKRDYYFAVIAFGIIVAAWLLNNAAANPPTGQEVEPFNLSEMRLENEDKLVVPDDKVEEVWSYLLDRLVNDKTFIKSLDRGLDSYWYDELFADIYFDTSDLRMLKRQSGIRYRRRENLTNPEHDKSGRELLQVKLNDVDSNALNRGEIKFNISQNVNLKTQDDVHPVLGRLKPADRAEFKQLVSHLGIDPYSLDQVLVLEQRRRSIYIPRSGADFISIRLDEVTSELLWADWYHVEIEPELNEVPYTEAGDRERAYMENINAMIIADIQQQFPYVQQDLTPKYNKAFEYFETKIPILRFLIKNKLL
jgi:hypothetical protein